MDYEEKEIFAAAKRCGIRRCPWMTDGDWFTSWSPRNSNSNAEGTWAHWVNLAAFILSHPATKEVNPEMFRPDLKADPSMYNGGKGLTVEQVQTIFATREQNDSISENQPLP
jgi:hypothetical protein